VNQEAVGQSAASSFVLSPPVWLFGPTREVGHQVGGIPCSDLVGRES